MKPVDQIIIDSKKGDCHRAVIASILELELDQVPHFRLYPDWWRVYYYFLYSFGWEYFGQFKLPRELREEDSINGYFDAAVKSRTFDKAYHGVVVDLNGVVVHDPNPNKKWQGVNVVETGELEWWYIFDKVKVDKE